MTPERWVAVGTIFDAALAVVTRERQAWVEQASKGDDEIRREVSSLLANHDAAPDGFVQQRIKKVLASFDEANADPHNATVGPYRLVRELGRGGMGTVFLAERNDDEYHAQVAIKLVRPGMDTEFILTRFRRERQTLARLQHPNIARLLDGGTTSKGVPYIVMEYIDGPSLTRYSKERNLGILQRLRLFMGICAAVEYAHRNFVVHRDVKPCNILVGSDGTPKLLDFGVCKLLRDDTAHSDIRAALTPAYASPEQISGGSGTPLSDIYSLGVVLYQLLAGVLPLRTVGHAAPPIAHAFGPGAIVPPSVAVKDQSLARELSGELDCIVLRALEFEPERRYQWAKQLSDDLRRYFARRPVHAMQQTRRYVALKFVQRNRWKVTALLTALVVLIVGLMVSLYEARVADVRLRQIQALATQAANVAPSDVSLNVYQSVLKRQEGDALAAAGNLAVANQAYSESSKSSEFCLKLAQAACLLIYVQSNRGLALNAVALGRRKEAIEFANRALHAAESLPSVTASGFVWPRAFAAMGLTYAALEKSPLRAPGDQRQAQFWLNKSSTAWHAAQSDSGFSPDDEHELKEVDETLFSTGNR
jgi:serine/threonine protein kinase